MPAGASGFTGDMTSTQSVTAAASTSDAYDSREFVCGRRMVSASNISVSNSSDDDIHHCSSDERRAAVKHNHTYPLTTAQRSPREHDDDRDTRCRDEKKATDMQVRSTATSLVVRHLS